MSASSVTAAPDEQMMFEASGAAGGSDGGYGGCGGGCSGGGGGGATVSSPSHGHMRMRWGGVLQHADSQLLVVYQPSSGQKEQLPSISPSAPMIGHSPISHFISAVHEPFTCANITA